MSRYRVIHTIDLAGDHEWLVIPEPNYATIVDLDRLCPNVPLWFDSPIAWCAADFSNPDIYVSVSETVVEF